jgi:hypothetical protein
MKKACYKVEKKLSLQNFMKDIPCMTPRHAGGIFVEIRPGMGIHPKNVPYDVHKMEKPTAPIFYG